MDLAEKVDGVWDALHALIARDLQHPPVLLADPPAYQCLAWSYPRGIAGLLERGALAVRRVDPGDAPGPAAGATRVDANDAGTPWTLPPLWRTARPRYIVLASAFVHRDWPRWCAFVAALGASSSTDVAPRRADPPIEIAVLTTYSEHAHRLDRTTSARPRTPLAPSRADAAPPPASETAEAPWPDRSGEPGERPYFAILAGALVVAARAHAAAPPVVVEIAHAPIVVALVTKSIFLVPRSIPPLSHDALASSASVSAGHLSATDSDAATALSAFLDLLDLQDTLYAVGGGRAHAMAAYIAARDGQRPRRSTGALPHKGHVAVILVERSADLLTPCLSAAAAAAGGTSSNALAYIAERCALAVAADAAATTASSLPSPAARRQPPCGWDPVVPTIGPLACGAHPDARRTLQALLAISARDAPLVIRKQLLTVAARENVVLPAASKAPSAARDLARLQDALAQCADDVPLRQREGHLLQLLRGSLWALAAAPSDRDTLAQTLEKTLVTNLQELSVSGLGYADEILTLLQEQLLDPSVPIAVCLRLLLMTAGCLAAPGTPILDVYQWRRLREAVHARYANAPRLDASTRDPCDAALDAALAQQPSYVDTLFDTLDTLAAAATTHAAGPRFHAAGAGMVTLAERVIRDATMAADSEAGVDGLASGAGADAAHRFRMGSAGAARTGGSADAPADDAVDFRQVAYPSTHAGKKLLSGFRRFWGDGAGHEAASGAVALPRRPPAAASTGPDFMGSLGTIGSLAASVAGVDAADSTAGASPRQFRHVVVFFVGGATLHEIGRIRAALKRTSASASLSTPPSTTTGGGSNEDLRGQPQQVLVGASSIIDTADMVQSLLQVKNVNKPGLQR
ncbi:hypothetical protein CXG81DRAFT_21401 [Caulochytrium protostelioides]|uniref:Sec1-like protein n=1 Tax=Caulochytrium protostelioides TaxID=1555241 RepID=A0A4P9WY46_9FUNG|nr:hypothetical protein CAUPRSCDRAFT_11267 [Caulochytrium protostelioides]RKO98354.1 hypothetical protein CXG81DRAFT_21401 [Caulochytrium protostelioides]|eukprot:RKO98354.1 hypothetical protein CXG81DRAFT_21401 [Caulochytrium protostelioides]